MINRTTEDYREVLDPRRARRAFLYRAGLGTVLIIVMVIGLSLYDAEPPTPPTADRPVEAISPVIGTPAEPLAPEETREDGEEGADLLADASAAVAGAGTAAEEATDEAELAPEPAEAPDDGAPETPQPPPAPSEAAAPQVPETVRQPASTARPAAAPADKRRYQIQLGGFMDAEAFAALDAAMSGLDDPVVTQFRVAVGPFPERAAADDVLNRLRRERAVRGIVVSEPAQGSYAVQAGVFAEAANADALSRKLAGWGYPVKLQQRAVAGPFPDRQAAEALQARLRQERGIESIIVEVPAR